MKALLYLVIALLAPGSPAFAQSRNVCAQPTTTNDVIECFETFHPDIQKLEANPVTIEGIRRESIQFPNPAVTLQTESGNNLGDVVGEDTVALSQLIEIGGKRSARAKLGSAKSDAVRADELSIRSQIRINTILNLIKYRQLTSEIAVLEEALVVYERVQRSFASRPRLSPEQQVTSGLFKFAVGDYKHRLSALVSERLVLETYFGLIPHLNFPKALQYLPQRPQKWPVFVPKNNNAQAAPLVKIAEANRNAADATFALEKANAIPDPVVSLIGIKAVESANEYNRFGIGVTIGLPVFNLNGGLKMQAAANQARSEIDLRRSIAQAELEKKTSLLTYQNYVRSLDSSPDAKDLEAKHRSTESLYYRGVVSGVLVIEAHRQMLDFTTNQNELEYETTQALLNLYLIDGRLGDFKL